MTSARGRCAHWLRLKGSRTDIDHCTRRDIAANMRAHLSAEFLADQFEEVAFRSIDAPVHRKQSAAFSLMESPGERSIPK